MMNDRGRGPPPMPLQAREHLDRVTESDYCTVLKSLLLYNTP